MVLILNCCWVVWPVYCWVGALNAEGAGTGGGGGKGAGGAWFVLVVAGVLAAKGKLVKVADPPPFIDLR